MCLRSVRQAIWYRSATTAMQVTSDCVAIGCRRIRYCRSCRSGCRREIRPPMPSARGRHRIRDRQAALRRSSPAIRGTPASGGGRKRPADRPTHRHLHLRLSKRHHSIDFYTIFAARRHQTARSYGKCGLMAIFSSILTPWNMNACPVKMFLIAPRRSPTPCDRRSTRLKKLLPPRQVRRLFRRKQPRSHGFRPSFHRGSSHLRFPHEPSHGFQILRRVLGFR